jgi:hypothetical protein
LRKRVWIHQLSAHNLYGVLDGGVTGRNEMTTFGRRHQKHLMKTYLCILKECKLTYKGPGFTKSLKTQCRLQDIRRSSYAVEHRNTTHQPSQISTDSPDWIEQAISSVFNSQVVEAI